MSFRAAAALVKVLPGTTGVSAWEMGEGKELSAERMGIAVLEGRK